MYRIKIWLAAMGQALARLGTAAAGWFDRRRLILAALGAAAFIAAYYALGMAIVHTIDDDLAFRPDPRTVPAGGSATVAMVVGLVDREVNRHSWVANDPFFWPPSALDNMPNYQQGMRKALALFAVELRDQIGRNRGSSAADPDLEIAASKLNYQGDIWIVAGVMPRQPSESAYKEAIAALERYNRRVEAGDAVYERRSDNLLATLDRLALDMGAASAAIDAHIGAHANDFIDFAGDDIFYDVKGRAYAICMIMTALERDFATVIADRDLTNVWGAAKDSLASLLEMRPWVVTNGEVDGQLLPNHLAAQGFYLMRARTQMREITNILLK